MSWYYIILSIVLFISFILVFVKSGRSFYKALIPFYNFYEFFNILDIHYIITIILFILISIPITSKFFILLLLINLPFMLADSFGVSFKYSVLALIFPIIFIPFIILKGEYSYDDNVSTEDDLDKMVEKSLEGCL